MANEVVFDPRLTKPDRLVLANLAGGLFQAKHAGNGHAAHGQANETSGTSIPVPGCGCPVRKQTRHGASNGSKMRTT